MDRLWFLGGAEEPGASCSLLETIDLDGVQRLIVVDAGGETNGPAPYSPESIGEVDAVLLTHAHLDHSLLTLLVPTKAGGGIYATSITIGLTLNIITDSTNFPSSPYRNDDFGSISRMAEEKFKVVSYGDQVDIGPGVYAYPIKAGHIPGAVQWVLVTPQHKYLFQGNASTEYGQFVEPAELPEDEIDVFIAEATYGDRNHLDPRIEMLSLISDAQKLLSEGGLVVCSAFSTIRAVLLAHVLLGMQRWNLLDPRIRIFYGGGMAREAERVLGRHARELNLDEIYRGFDLEMLATGQTRLLDDAFYISSASEAARWVRSGVPAIHLYTPGMLQGGLSLAAVRALNEMPVAAKSGLFFTGYLNPDSPGYQINLFKSGRVDIGGEELDLRIGKVAKYGFSGHLDQKQQLENIGHLKPQLVIPVHGSRNARQTLATQLNLLGVPVKLVRNGEILYVDEILRNASRDKVADLVAS